MDDYLKEMQEIAEIDDQELRHCEADDLLCRIVADLGYVEVVKVFESFGKWYA